MRSVCPHGNVVHPLPISKLNGPKGVRPKPQSLNHFNAIKFIANFTVDIYPEITQRFIPHNSGDGISLHMISIDICLKCTLSGSTKLIVNKKCTGNLMLEI